MGISPRIMGVSILCWWDSWITSCCLLEILRMIFLWTMPKKSQEPLLADCYEALYQMDHGDVYMSILHGNPFQPSRPRNDSRPWALPHLQVVKEQRQSFFSYSISPMWDCFSVNQCFFGGFMRFPRMGGCPQIIQTYIVHFSIWNTYPLVNQHSYWKWIIYSWFTHKK